MRHSCLSVATVYFNIQQKTCYWEEGWSEFSEYSFSVGKNWSFFHLFNYMKELCERLYFSTRYPCGWMLSPETFFLEKCWHLESVKGDCRESWWKQALVIFSSNYTELQSSQQLCLLPFLGKAKLNGLRRTLISLCVFFYQRNGASTCFLFIFFLVLT